MHTRRRLLATLVVFAVSACGIVMAVPESVRHVYLDAWNFSDNGNAREREAAERARLEMLDASVRRRTELKGEIVQDVIDERLSLREAAERFAALNAAYPSIAATTREQFPAATDEESAALQVICHVENHLLADPAARASVKRRLRLEFGASTRGPPTLSRSRD